MEGWMNTVTEKGGGLTPSVWINPFCLAMGRAATPATQIMCCLSTVTEWEKLVEQSH